MAFTKTLQGVIRITENGDYNLVLPSNGARAQNDLAINNVEEVYIIVEQIEILPIQVEIMLPKISDFNGGWNTKIYLLTKSRIPTRDSYITLVSYNGETYNDWINTFENQSFQLWGTTSVHIYDNNYWGAHQSM